MYIEKYYSKKHSTAYVVLGHCRNMDEIMHEIDLFSLETNIKVPAEITLREVAHYQYQNMTVLKFQLHPSGLFETQYAGWIILDDNPDLIRLLKPKS